MQTHPDRNPDPNAKALFLEINNAYEILTGQKPLPKHKHSPSSSPKHTAQSKQEKEREARREKIKEAKKRQEEAYRNSPQFKMDLAIGTVLDQIGYFLAILIMLAIPFLIFSNALAGFVIALMFAAISSPFWHKAWVKGGKTINVKHFIIATKYILKYSKFKYFLFGAINFTAILVFIFNTFIPLYLVWIAMLLPTLYMLFKQKFHHIKYKKEDWYKASSIGPLVVNMFFMLNFIFSHSTNNEYYKVSPYYKPSASFFMTFEFDAYDEYPGIRFFMTYDDHYFPYARLKTAKGLFGIKVLKQYDFVRHPGKPALKN